MMKLRHLHEKSFVAFANGLGDSSHELQVQSWPNTLGQTLGGQVSVSDFLLSSPFPLPH